MFGIIGVPTESWLRRSSLVAGTLLGVASEAPTDVTAGLIAEAVQCFGSLPRPSNYPVINSKYHQILHEMTAKVRTKELLMEVHWVV